MTYKTYRWNDSVQLTKNINVREVRCKDGSRTKINLDHIQKVQNFMERNGFTKIIISSGYRSPNYNKRIGGSTRSQHCLGNAIDCCFYKGSRLISAKDVCCLAQDYGFKGIAYINKNYVHLDSRPYGIYRGDETKGYSNNVGNDFYKYFHKVKIKLPKLPSRGYFIIYDKGAEVKNLQKALNHFNKSKNSVDGIIGANTINEVKKFQRANHLKADGYFGKNCLAKAKELL